MSILEKLELDRVNRNLKTTHVCGWIAETEEVEACVKDGYSNVTLCMWLKHDRFIYLDV